MPVGRVAKAMALKASKFAGKVKAAAAATMVKVKTKTAPPLAPAKKSSGRQRKEVVAKPAAKVGTVKGSPLKGPTKTKVVQKIKISAGKPNKVPTGRLARKAAVAIVQKKTKGSKEESAAASSHDVVTTPPSRRRAKGSGGDVSVEKAKQNESTLRVEDSDGDEGPAEDQKVLGVVQHALSAHGHSLVFMASPMGLQSSSVDEAVQAVIQRRHLAISQDCAGVLLQCLAKVEKAGKENDMAMWEVLLSLGTEAAEQVEDGKPVAAFGPLMAVLIFALNVDPTRDWLLEPKMWEKRRADMEQFFDRVASSWRAVLALDDEELGLRPPIGLPGGYRVPLVEMLKQFEAVTNATLHLLDPDSGDEGTETTKVARATPKGKAKAKASKAKAVSKVAPQLNIFDDA